MFYKATHGTLLFMVHAPSLKRTLTHIAGLSGAHVFFTGCTWLFFLALARWHGPQAAGHFTFAAATLNPLMILSYWGLRNDLSAKDATKTQPQLYKTTRLILLCTALLGLGVYLAFTTPSIAFLSVLGGLLVMKIAENGADLSYGFAQQSGKQQRVTLSFFVRGFILLSFGLTLLFFSTLPYALLGVGLGWLAFYFIYDSSIYSFYNNRLKVKLKDISHLLKSTTPLALSLFILSFTISMPRYFLGHTVGFETLGIFGAMATLLAAGQPFINALGHTLTPMLARHYQNTEERHFCRLVSLTLLGLLLAGGAACLIIAFLGKPILSLLYGASFAQHPTVFFHMTLAASIGFLGSFLTYALTAARAFKTMFILTLFTLLTTTFSSMIFIPEHGLQGAAWVLIITQVLHFLGHFIALNLHVCRRKPKA